MSFTLIVDEHDQLFKILENNQFPPNIEKLYYPGCESDTNENNETPLMIWIRRFPKTNIPKKLFYNIPESDKFKVLKLWIKHRHHEEVPSEFMTTGFSQDEHFHLLNDWIEHRLREPIPDILKYPNWTIKTNYLGWSHLFQWINSRQYEDIPAELVATEEQLRQRIIGDKTPIMYWCLKHCQTTHQQTNICIPECLMYPNWQTDRDIRGQTPLMIWVSTHDSKIPNKLLYSDCFDDVDYQGQSCLMIYLSTHPESRVPTKLCTQKNLSFKEHRYLRTPLMIYIETHRGIVLDSDLEQLYYYGWWNDEDIKRHNALQIWIRVHHDLDYVPQILLNKHYLQRPMNRKILQKLWLKYHPRQKMPLEFQTNYLKNNLESNLEAEQI